MLRTLLYVFLISSFSFCHQLPVRNKKKPDNLEEYINNKLCICNLPECFRHSKNKKTGLTLSLPTEKESPSCLADFPYFSRALRSHIGSSEELHGQTSRSSSRRTRNLPRKFFLPVTSSTISCKRSPSLLLSEALSLGFRFTEWRSAKR